MIAVNLEKIKISTVVETEEDIDDMELEKI